MLNSLTHVLTKYTKPSAFFEVYRGMNNLDIYFPELIALIGVPQNTEWHQEGDVWKHTMMVIDEAASVRDLVSDPMRFMLAALCHDFGKAVVTETVDGETHAYSHEDVGVPIARQFLERLGADDNTISYVTKMVQLHMKPHRAFERTSHIKKTNQMFFESPDPYDLIFLALCDSAGRIPSTGTFEERAFLVRRATEYMRAMRMPYVTEEDLISDGYIADTEKFTQAKELAHKLRMAMVDKDIALKQIRGSIRPQK